MDTYNSDDNGPLLQQVWYAVGNALAGGDPIGATQKHADSFAGKMMDELNRQETSVLSKPVWYFLGRVSFSHDAWKSLREGQLFKIVFRNAITGSQSHVMVEFIWKALAAVLSADTENKRAYFHAGLFELTCQWITDTMEQQVTLAHTLWLCVSHAITLGNSDISCIVVCVDVRLCGCYSVQSQSLIAIVCVTASVCVSVCLCGSTRPIHIHHPS